MDTAQQSTEIGRCSVCSRGPVEQLTRIAHDDGSVTTYWQCAACSHVRVTRSQPGGGAGQGDKEFGDE